MAMGAIIGIIVMILGGIASFFVTTLLSALVLWLTTKMFSIKAGFGKAFGIALILGLIAFGCSFAYLLVASVAVFIPFFGDLLAIFMGFFSIIAYPFLGLIVAVVAAVLIKKKYALEWGKALLVWLVWLVIMSVICGILFGILAVVGVFGMALTGTGWLI